MPSATSASIASHSADAAADVETRRRLVEEEDGRAGDERGGEVEAAAHAARVGAHEPVAGLGQVEGGEQLACALARGAAAEVVEPADHLEVLEARQVLVDGRVLAGEADPLAHLRCVADDVEAGDARRAASGRSSVVRIRTAVVLPAPFGPSSPKTLPASTWRSTPRSASTSP